MTSDNPQNEEEEILSYPDDGSRPHIDAAGTGAHNFCPWDEVMIVNLQTQAREGPYYVKEATQGRYLLCDDKGNTVKEGRLFQEAELVLYDPFA